MSDLTDIEALEEYRTETARLRTALRALADTVQPGRGYSGDWIAHMARQILDGGD